MKDAVTIKVSKAVPAHKGPDTDEIVITPPTGKQWFRYGPPATIKMQTVDGKQVPTPEINTPIVRKYLEDCANVPVSSIENLPISDAIACTGAIVDFLADVENPEKSS